MSRLLLFILLTMFFDNLHAQKLKDLGCAEKVWVLTHPFSANKARKTSIETKQLVDSVAQTKDWLTMGTGGHKDAFRHGMWMALLSSRIGHKRAIWLGKAHEKKNKRDFRKERLEDGALPDQVAIEMDLINNKVGAEIGRNCKKCSRENIINQVLDALDAGQLSIIKMNKKGQFLNEENQIIPEENWQGKWENDRVLAPSNSI